jgi:hypothetical protein
MKREIEVGVPVGIGVDQGTVDGGVEGLNPAVIHRGVPRVVKVVKIAVVVAVRIDHIAGMIVGVSVVTGGREGGLVIRNLEDGFSPAGGQGQIVDQAGEISAVNQVVINELLIIIVQRENVMICIMIS